MKLKKKKFDKVFIFSGSLRYLLIAKIAGVSKIARYPLFKKKDNIVLSAKIFVENELHQIINTEPKINIDKNKIKKIQNKFDSNFKHICLAVSASGPTKIWNIKNYI